MFEDLELKNIKVSGNGSTYPVKNQKTGEMDRFGLAFYYQVNSGKKLRKVITGDSKELVDLKARRFLKETDQEAEQNKNTIVLHKNGIKTFAEVADEWMEDYVATHHPKGRNVSYSVKSNREQAIARLNRAIGQVAVHVIDNDLAIKLFTDELIYNEEKGKYYSYSYVDKLEQTFRCIMNFALDKQYTITRIKKVQLPNMLIRPKPDQRFMDREKIRILQEAVKDNPMYSLIVEILINTGLRQEELFALGTDSFCVTKDFDGAEITEIIINRTCVEVDKNTFSIVPYTKTLNSLRNVVIPSELKDKILDYHRKCLDDPIELINRRVNKTEKYIFVNSQGCSINIHNFAPNIKKYVMRHCPEGSFEAFGLHQLRHSFCSLMAERIPAEQLAKLVGDDYNTIYKNYYSLSSKAKTSIVNSIREIYNTL
ncbi:MAG: tyrosine-type recombinase/integrase [Butyrivibrio sp.]|nr:tyrosine-type recombinase/integrase [Butyrivibrio sp.]